MDAAARLLVLTTPEFFAIFKKASKGADAAGIVIIYIPLAAEMQAEG